MSPAVWVELLGLGAFHGANPSMGWLFAVAIGLQERRLFAVIRSFAPIAIGHLVSIVAVAVAILLGVAALTTRVTAIVGGILLVGVGMWLILSRRHFRWVGMRLGSFQLASWSFLMASVHGAGLMLIPVLLAGADPRTDATGAVVSGVLAGTVHTAAMVVVGGVIAVLVHQVLGVRILRGAWLNLDRVWAWVLVLAGVGTVASAFV